MNKFCTNLRVQYAILNVFEDVVVKTRSQREFDPDDLDGNRKVLNEFLHREGVTIASANDERDMQVGLRGE